MKTTHAKALLPLWYAMRPDDHTLDICLQWADSGDTEAMDYYAQCAFFCHVESSRKEHTAFGAEAQGWRDAARVALIVAELLQEKSGFRRLGPEPARGWPAHRYARRIGEAKPRQPLSNA